MIRVMIISEGHEYDINEMTHELNPYYVGYSEFLKKIELLLQNINQC